MFRNGAKLVCDESSRGVLGLEAGRQQDGMRGRKAAVG